MGTTTYETTTRVRVPGTHAVSCTRKAGDRNSSSATAVVASPYPILNWNSVEKLSLTDLSKEKELKSNRRCLLFNFRFQISGEFN